MFELWNLRLSYGWVMFELCLSYVCMLVRRHGECCQPAGMVLLCSFFLTPLLVRRHRDRPRDFKHVFRYFVHVRIHLCSIRVGPWFCIALQQEVQPTGATCVFISTFGSKQPIRRYVSFATQMDSAINGKAASRCIGMAASGTINWVANGRCMYMGATTRATARVWAIAVRVSFLHIRSKGECAWGEQSSFPPSNRCTLLGSTQNDRFMALRRALPNIWSRMVLRGVSWGI